MTATFPGLSTYLRTEGAHVERALERAVAQLRQTAGGSPGGDALGGVPADVLDAVEHGVLSGGKRLRPILCVTAWRAVKEGAVDRPPVPAEAESTDPNHSDVAEAVYDLAASIELIHAYSLMHDDLPCMDDAELRRGRPTTHRVHGEDVTTRAGAVLIPAAGLQAWRACAALGLDPSIRRAVVGRLMTASGAAGMVGGQWVDLLGEGQALDATQLDALHRMKTGALLTASLVLGGLAAEAPPEQLEAYERYGAGIGLAFQIADDVLDATQTAETLGKNPSDAELDKSTYVALHGLDEARRRAAEEVDEAVRALGVGGIRSPALEALARYVVEREK